MLKFEVAPVGSVGNANFPASGGKEVDAVDTGVAFCFTVEAVGATPTVTYKWQGSIDGVTFEDLAYHLPASDALAVATRVRTTVATDCIFLASPASRIYRYYRLVTSANVNVTFRGEIYTPD